jgi:putative thiamine transport system permease protein
MKRVFQSLPLFFLFAMPLVASLIFALGGIFNIDAWTSLFAHPQLWPALQLSVVGGLVSTLLSLVIATFITAGLYKYKNLSPNIGAMLAVPHLAVAVGVSFVIMPSGLLARAIALFSGWQAPPDWVTTHDPYGLALIFCLVLKEVPFLIWVLISILNRDDMWSSFSLQRSTALSLGHGTMSIWCRIFLPQLLPLMKWPLLVTFVYAATVVDMALVIGPTQPPTLGTIIWADLNSAQVNYNARGAAGAWLLSAAVAGTAMGVLVMIKFLSTQRRWLTVGPGTGTSVPDLFRVARVKYIGLIFIYSVVVLALAALSFATLWPFPHLWPNSISVIAWLRVVQNPSALFTSLALAISTALTALAIVVTWLESQPAKHDQWLLVLSATALGLPAILLSLGQYRLFLQIGLTGTAAGLFLAHLVSVTGYIFIFLVGPYRAFDRRWQSSAYGLLSSFSRFFWEIKLPLLKAPLLAAGAVGFAVSFGQYIPAQLIGAGRFSTLPIEAVTLTSGSNRPLTAAFGLMLLVPPLLVFFAARYYSKPRWDMT